MFDNFSHINISTLFSACKYGNKCVQLGERVTEVCDILICNYDDKAMGYELMLESQGILCSKYFMISML